MKTPIFAIALGLIVALPGIGSAAGKDDKPSDISAYAGKYKGTVVLSGNNVAYPGTAQANFRTSKKKESGTLSITSLVNAGGTLAPISVTYTIRNRSLTYFLSIAGSAVQGSGTVKVGANRISYSAILPVSPGTNYQALGTITVSKKRLSITETLLTGGSSAVFSYSLKRKK